MEIKELQKRPDIEQDKRLHKAYTQFEKLVTELRKRELPSEIKIVINDGIEEINTSSKPGKGLRKQLRKTQTSLLNLLEKQLKVAPKNHYRNTWLAIGMGAFGIPFGAVFGAIMGNMGLIGIGLPIGMVIGMIIGTSMDKQALERGRQLDIEINY
ncbi:MAG: hypothetical protein ACI9IP_003488 [Arcticibacterium sp.]|jgi:hypothetical protein